MLRILLPPNLVAAAARDALAVKVELDPRGSPPPDLLPVLAWLQQQVGPQAKSPLFLQLSRAQLRQLLLLGEDFPVFFWVNRPTEPLPWRNGALAGVSEHVEDPEPAGVGPPSTVAPPTPARRPAKAAGEAGPPLSVDGSEHFLALTPPARGHPTYEAAIALVRQNGFVFETSNRRWWLRDRHKTLNFLAAHWAQLRDEFGAEFTPNFEHNTERLRLAGAACSVVPAGDGFDVTVALRTGPAAPATIQEALDAGRAFAETGSEIVLLPPATVTHLASVQRDLANDAAATFGLQRTVHLGGSRLAEAEPLLESLAPDFQPPPVWRARSEALRNLSKLTPAPVPAELDQRLRPYQRVGVAWLWHLYRHNLGGILADEMGLGKTVETLAFLAALQQAKRQTPNPKSQTGTPSLVVCPASLVENWRREAARFTPGLRVVAHHGGQRDDTAAGFSQTDLIVTSYGTLVRDRALFESLTFACVIGDEAQHIKNRRTQNAQALRALRAGGRFLLTGTPVENRLDDLRSLFEFLMPGYLAAPPAGTGGDERAWYDDRLRAQTAPYLLRRTKTVVAPELPPKIEQAVYCELPPAQAALYREWRERGERELAALADGGASEGSLRLATFTLLLRLRQICCDPRLVDDSWAADMAPAKLEAFRELLEEAVDDGHRLLVFSQFTSLLALLRRELETQALAYCYLDGSMPARARHAEIDRFQQSVEVPVFLISLKAGGYGLNLTGADVVVHFDPWWNPAVEAQATDRAHRIGQTRPVTSYKLICAGTVEETVVQLQETKRALLPDVFEASEAAAAGLSLADLRALLS